MIVTNSDLKCLMSMHNFLPNTPEEMRSISDEHKKAIVQYERVLIKLLEQKIIDNENTRLYLELKSNKNSCYGSTAKKGKEK